MFCLIYMYMYIFFFPETKAKKMLKLNGLKAMEGTYGTKFTYLQLKMNYK